MRYIKLITAALLIALCCALSACGFVSYSEYREDSGAQIGALIDEYIERIDSLSKEQFYEGEYRREFVLTLIDAKNELRECKTAAELEEVFSRHSEIILAIPTDILMTLEYVSEQIRLLAAENAYRAEQQEQVDWLVWYYGSLLEGVTTVPECEALLRDFKTALGNIKTDAQLKIDELEEMKAQYSLQFGSDIDYSLYRTTERETLEAIEKSFRAEIKNTKSIEETDATRAIFNERVKAVKTEAQLLAEEREIWRARWQVALDSFSKIISIDISSEIKDCLEKIDEVMSEDEADRICCSLILSYADTLGEASLELMKNLTSIYVGAYVGAESYREDEQKQIEKIIDSSEKELSSVKTVESLKALINKTEAELDKISTNDALWEKENAEFALHMQNKYLELALDAPSELAVANSTEELARIIDYYAFYQLDGKSFERATFRVELNYAHRYAEWIIRDVYWCCELLRSAVGITGYFEQDSSQLVITLIPYDIASKSHTDKPLDIVRYDSLIEYSSDSTLLGRAEDFDSFPYYDLYKGREITVWNSQQLWYALEHEYIPIPVKDSPADLLLKRAKEILRDIIKDGMTIEEKVFAIYSWYADNITYDHKYKDYVDTDDMENFPDERVAVLNSLHAEGVLLDNLAVCCSYAKAGLILMRLEGIEAYRVILHDYEENGMTHPDNIAFGSHAILALRASDGKFYYCDLEQCGAGEGLMYQKYHQLLVTAKEQAPYGNCVDRIWKHKLDWGEALPRELFWNNIKYNGKCILVSSAEEAKAIIDEYCASAKRGYQINILTTEDIDKEIRSLLNAEERISYNPYQHGGFNEYMIYCAEK